MHSTATKTQNNKWELPNADAKLTLQLVHKICIISPRHEDMQNDHKTSRDEKQHHVTQNTREEMQNGHEDAIRQRITGLIQNDLN